MSRSPRGAQGKHRGWECRSSSSAGGRWEGPCQLRVGGGGPRRLQVEVVLVMLRLVGASPHNPRTQDMKETLC